MNFNKDNPKFCVYVHTSPSGKKYVGITSQQLKDRWGISGKGYIENKHFWNAIKKYGWDKFTHEIVTRDVDLEEASRIECALIKHYNSMNPEYGYNQTTGGNWSKPSSEVRKKLSDSQKLVWQDPEYRLRMCKIQKSLQRKPLTEIHKKHISEYWKTHDHPLKGTHLSEEQKRHISECNKGREAWNKGYTKHTHESVMKISKTLQNREFSSITKARMRSSRLKLYAEGYSPIWINNGMCEKQIISGSELPEGYQYGRLDSVYITDGRETKKINPEKLDSYMSAGWKLGKSQKIQDNIKKSRQQFIWEFEGQGFSSATELAKYLNQHGYPEIVGSTITSLYLKGFKSSKKYSSLDGRIVRKSIDEN